MASSSSLTPLSTTNFSRLNDSQLAPSPVIEDSIEGYPNLNVQNNSQVYTATYSGAAVFEMMVRGIGVMRRRSDHYLNATQILKVAGVDKGKRTKIIEKSIVLGVHEKIQGGYGRYQGTWIPFEKAVELATAYNVAELILPLLEYVPPPSVSLATPSTSTLPFTSTSALPFNGGGASSRMVQAMSHDGASAAAILGNAHLQQQSLAPEVGGSGDESRKRLRDGYGLQSDEPIKRPKFETGSTWTNPNGSIGLEGLEAIANGGGIGSTDGEDGTKLKRSTKAVRGQSNSLVDDPLRAAQHKDLLKSIFSNVGLESLNGPKPDLAAVLPTDLDPDTSIDDLGNTALHWASALANPPMVEALVEFGSDIYRGNNQGETPLIRAVLVTNNSEQDTLPRLLEIIGTSLRTTDDLGRTALHHSAISAGIKGRASSARYSMESILEYLVRNETSRGYKDLIDAQDIHGDTALNIAARVGNRGLVRMLIELGADKVVPNKLGLRPRDFGVAGADLEITPAEEVIASLRGPPPVSAPVHKSQEVISSLTTIINSLSSDFAIELKEKSDALDRTRLLLRSAARDLSDRRKLIDLAKAKVAQVDEKKQRIKNLEKALLEEDSFDWTGRTEVDKTPARIDLVGPGFTFRGPASTLSNLPAGISIDFDTDPPLPATDGTSGDPIKNLVHLTRLSMWYERVIGLLRDRVGKVEHGIEANESKLRRIVSSCCGVEETEVESILEGLLAALETDGTGLDLARVAAFMTKVNREIVVDV